MEKWKTTRLLAFPVYFSKPLYEPIFGIRALLLLSVGKITLVGCSD